MRKAQGALEYLLLVGGAVLVAGIAIVMILGVSQGGTSSAYNPVYSTIARQVMASNGVGWWKLDNITGLTDLSGKGNSGTGQGGITIGEVTDHAGKVGGATSFDGVSNYVDIGPRSSLDLTSVGTISAWVKSNRSYPSDTTSVNYRPILSKAFSGGAAGISYWIDWYGTNTARAFRARLSNGSTSDGYGISDFDFGTSWRHIVYVWDGANHRLYVDGVAQTPVPQAVNAQVLSTTSVTIGRGFGSGYYWDGSISDVRIYNRALSASEVLAIYNSS